MEFSEADAARALVRWYAEMGVDEAISAEPTDFYAISAASEQAPKAFHADRNEKTAPTPIFKPPPEPASLPADEAVAAAEEAAKACPDLDALIAAVNNFDGCALKTGAANTVFIDGARDADLLIIGEAPGRDEDRIGKPFVGRAGQLLDQMLAAINRQRDSNVLISNAIFWRPPGNRTPTQTETAVCKPFVMRLIDLTKPKVVVLTGGAALQALTGTTGIMRARGVWRELETPEGTYPALPIFHPAFLLRQPAHKRLAWTDLLALEEKLTAG